MLAGREEEVEVFRRSLDSTPEMPANLRLTGLRGVGKTVLLTEIESVAEVNSWETALVELEPRHNTAIHRAVSGNPGHPTPLQQIRRIKLWLWTPDDIARHQGLGAGADGPGPCCKTYRTVRTHWQDRGEAISERRTIGVVKGGDEPRRRPLSRQE